MQNAFVVDFHLKYSNLSTFYKYRIMKIPKTNDAKMPIYEDWCGNDGLGDYKLLVDNSLLARCQKEYSPQICQLLQRLKECEGIYSLTIRPNQDMRFLVENPAAGNKCAKTEYERRLLEMERQYPRWPEANRLEDVGQEIRDRIKTGELKAKWKYFNTVFSPGLAGVLAQLFLSTRAYAAANMEWPMKDPNGKVQTESCQFTFDWVNKTATLTGLVVYEPKDPYYIFARENMRPRNPFRNSGGDEGVLNYYLEEEVTGWEAYDPATFQGNIGSAKDVTGVYMLYNSVKGTFYVGKADHVYKRMQEHRDNARDTIRDFDYFRYSLIDPYYEEDIFLLENAAIHDCAMLFTMPHGKAYKEKALATLLRQKKTAPQLDQVCMVNKVERQTRKRNKKQ